MVDLVGTGKGQFNRQKIHSSSITKNGISAFDGRSASFFRIDTSCCVNRDSI